MAEFGPVLRKFRKAAGFSQERLAGESGVSVEAIKTLENGRRRYPWTQTVNLLAAGLRLDARDRAVLKAAAARPKIGINRLPPDVADFVGRAEQVAAVSELLTDGGQAPGVVVISAIAGMGGVGKTALAVHVARELAGRFGDGVLYVNLRGFGVGEPMTPLEALNALLQQLGFALQRPPDSAEEAGGLFRTASAARKLLLVLDNVASVEQVLPLLPGTATCAVIVTSRRALVGLPGARSLALPVLPADEALTLLTSAAGRERIEGEPQAAVEVVALCGSLPLALRIAGRRLAAESTWTVADLAHQLADETARLDVLADTERGVRASIALSLNGTSAADRAAYEIFGLLGLHEGDELDLKVAARLVDRPEKDVEPLLEHLVDLHLLESSGPRRYQFHDLVRAYARELAATTSTADERAAAQGRVFALYVAMAWQSRVKFGIRRPSRDYFEEEWLSGAEDLEYDEVLDWLDVEASEIVAAAGRLMAGPHPDRAAVVRLAAGMVVFWAVRRRQSEGPPLDELALTALRDDPACAPPMILAFISHHTGQHYAARSDFDTSIVHLRSVIEVCSAQGDQSFLSLSMPELALCLERVGRLDEAMVVARSALDLALSLADDIAESEARLSIGVIAGRLGWSAEQDRSFELGESLIRRSSPEHVDFLISTIGESYLRCNRNESARSWLLERQAEFRASGNKSALAELLQSLGAAEIALTSYDAAAPVLFEALELNGDNNSELEARIRHQLGRALNGLGQTEPAREQWLLALELYTRYGLPQADEVQGLLNG
ncbi:helix-turn-helix domain-containing protein [Kribbella antibiotica]|uniref:Helix-turn-helix domain-containing protein n=1 Tax=Kribbella antibiotica TaxID=190195 RepID=A0A4R4ZRC1_9ACTN|nr:XRE family transcriptional regulator [Kribbella antibiotica]TDD60449.1 helix-turn-helix domain-containing protein [Kribbella antibiotica]